MQVKNEGLLHRLLGPADPAKFLELIKKAVREYKVDGAILHSNRSCKPISMGQFDIRQILADELQIPSVMFDGDHMDGDKFSFAQFQTRIDAFLEMLTERKYGKGRRA